MPSSPIPLPNRRSVFDRFFRGVKNCCWLCDCFYTFRVYSEYFSGTGFSSTISDSNTLDNIAWSSGLSSHFCGVLRVKKKGHGTDKTVTMPLHVEARTPLGLVASKSGVKGNQFHLQKLLGIALAQNFPTRSTQRSRPSVHCWLPGLLLRPANRPQELIDFFESAP